MFAGALRQTIASIVEKATDVVAPRLHRASREDQAREHWDAVLAWYRDRGFEWVLQLDDRYADPEPLASPRSPYAAGSALATPPATPRSASASSTSTTTSSSLLLRPHLTVSTASSAAAPPPPMRSVSPTRRRSRTSTSTSSAGSSAISPAASLSRRWDSEDQLYGHAIPELADTPLAAHLQALLKLAKDELRAASSSANASGNASPKSARSPRHAGHHRLAASVAPMAAQCTTVGPMDMASPWSPHPPPAAMLALAPSASGSASSLLPSSSPSYGPCTSLVLRQLVLPTLVNAARENIPAGMNHEAVRFVHSFLVDVAAVTVATVPHGASSLLVDDTVRHPVLDLVELTHDMVSALRGDRRVRAGIERLDLECDLMRLVNAVLRTLNPCPADVPRFFVERATAAAPGQGATPAFPLLEYLLEFAPHATEAGNLARESALLVAGMVEAVPRLEAILLAPTVVAAVPAPSFLARLAAGLNGVPAASAAGGGDAVPLRHALDHFAFLNHFCLVLPPTAVLAVSVLADGIRTVLVHHEQQHAAEDEAELDEPVSSHSSHLPSPPASETSSPRQPPSPAPAVGALLGAGPTELGPLVPRFLASTPACHPLVRRALVAAMPSHRFLVPATDLAATAEGATETRFNTCLAMLTVYADLIAAGDAAVALPSAKALAIEDVDDAVMAVVARLVEPGIHALAARFHPEAGGIDVAASVEALNQPHPLHERSASQILAGWMGSVAAASAPVEQRAAQAAAGEVVALASALEAAVVECAERSVATRAADAVTVDVNQLATMWMSLLAASSGSPRASSDVNGDDVDASDDGLDHGMTVLAMTSVWRAVTLAAPDAVVDWVFLHSDVFAAPTLARVPFPDQRVAAEFQLEMGLALFLRHAHRRAAAAATDARRVWFATEADEAEEARRREQTFCIV
ncbi:hypothetical protein H9P43_000528 [Blastocladiella emersonii ATCC 22665]|nr:hypothetical protein H9P43_000528 [Blastocladiella emersonii ATCC 22665]